VKGGKGREREGEREREREREVASYKENPQVVHQVEQIWADDEGTYLPV